MADLDLCELDLNEHPPGVWTTGPATGCISLQVLEVTTSQNPNVIVCLA